MLVTIKTCVFTAFFFTIILTVINLNTLSTVTELPKQKILYQTLNYLNQSLSDEPLVHWLYKDIFQTLDAIKMNEYDLNRSIHVPKKSLFKNVLKKAMKGEDVWVVIIGGSISAGALFENIEEKMYHAILQNYWNNIFTPLNSTLHIENLSLGASSSRFFAFCLENYISSNKTVDIVIWESSANDWFVLKPPDASYLELLTRRLIDVFQKPPLIIHLHLTLGAYAPCQSILRLGGTNVSQHYDIPLINWHTIACENKKGNRQNIWGADGAHPSVFGHAQIAYLLIYMFRNVFRFYVEPMVATPLKQSLDEYLRQEVVSVKSKKALYMHTLDAVCYTNNVVANGRKSDNSDKLKLKIIQNDGYRNLIGHGFKVRQDKIQGLGISGQPNKTLHFEIEVPKSKTAKGWRLYVGTYGVKWSHANITLDGLLLNYKLTSDTFGLIMTPVAFVTEGKHDLVFKSGHKQFLLTSIALN